MNTNDQKYNGKDNETYQIKIFISVGSDNI